MGDVIEARTVRPPVVADPEDLYLYDNRNPASAHFALDVWLWERKWITHWLDEIRDDMDSAILDTHNAGKLNQLGVVHNLLVDKLRDLETYLKRSEGKSASPRE